MNITQPAARTVKQAKRPSRDERVVQIYLTAAEIIDSKGYDATSLHDIADAVGLTKAGLYHYLRSKEQLLFEIMNYAMDRVDSAVIDRSKAIEDPEHRIREIVSAYAYLIIDKGQHLTIINNETNGLTPAHQRKIKQRRRYFYDFVRDAVQRLKDDGKLAGVDTSVTALALFGVMMWLARWYKRDGRLTRQQVVDEITELTVSRMLGLSGQSHPRKKG